MAQISVPACWLKTYSGPDVKLSTFHQQSMIQPDCHVSSVHHQGCHIGDVIRIQSRLGSNGEEYVRRSGRIVGMADDSSTVVLELYPLLEDTPSGNDQKEKASEVGDAGLNLQGTSSAEDSDRLQVQIIHVNHDLIVVIL